MGAVKAKSERNDMCEAIEKYAVRSGSPNIRCYIMTEESGMKSYAICDDKDWIYANSLAEAIAVHIDIMRLQKRSSTPTPQGDER